MSYPGNKGLSVQAQERVMTAFKQVLSNLQAGQREEAQIGLEFVLRLDPGFLPATNLQRQLKTASNEIDLGDIIAQLQAPTTDAIDALLIEAVDDFNSREFLSAKEKVEKVLIDLPGHQHARELRDQIDEALKIESQVGQFLIQAREALAAGDPQEAANFVMMAQALDPHHTGIATTLKEIDETGGLALSQEVPEENQASGPETVATGTTDGGTVAPGSEAVFGDPAPSTESPATTDDAFAVPFEADDPFADLVDPMADSTPPVSDDIADEASSPPAFESPADDVGFPSMDDAADLFAAPPGMTAFDEPTPAGDPGYGEPTASGSEGEGEQDVAETIRDLVERGQRAMDAGDEPMAISLWSRVFLIKPNHPEAGHLIVAAKRSLAEKEGQIEQLLARARDAYDSGDFEAAGLLINEIAAIRPNHLEMTLLREELARELGGVPGPTASARAPAAPEPAPSEPQLPELDDDLFADVSGEAAAEPAGAVASAIADVADDHGLFDEDAEDFDDFEDVTLMDRIRERIPVRIAAVAAIALVVVLAGIWLGSRMFSAEPEIDQAAAVNEVLEKADRLFKEHKVDEALHLLRQFPATGLFKQRIDNRIARYEESIAPPTPTPVPEEASQAQTLLDQGLWWAAFVSAAEGLERHPGDAGLEEIRSTVLEIEPEAGELEDAIRVRDYRAVVSITEELLLQYPEQGDLRLLLERALFNAALAEARAYNLTGAENHLVRLLELKPEDEEAVRFVEMVRRYKVQAADMRLEIFIRSLNER